MDGPSLQSVFIGELGTVSGTFLFMDKPLSLRRAKATQRLDEGEFGPKWRDERNMGDLRHETRRNKRQKVKQATHTRRGTVNLAPRTPPGDPASFFFLFPPPQAASRTDVMLFRPWLLT
ncbi:hypothetical protein M407DRAFT_90731 [Tulasnella calospora MUT 4182]|uniref:Uncharacterized protein n=1 Tax=Tulasnella calospora MUT 4182 TaxID=1051891 RepID=A0A0C3LG44_9AGAM|nr:hypothetical protein M407DRAFT_90731 [Tulasnella calospora MUT 4182]